MSVINFDFKLYLFSFYFFFRRSFLNNVITARHTIILAVFSRTIASKPLATRFNVQHKLYSF